MPPDESLPIVEPLAPVPDAEEAFLRLAALPHVVWLDSARRDATLGRYSFLAADPFDYFTSRIDEPAALARLASRLAPFSAPTRPDLPPFQGGAAGLFSYDLHRQLERIPPARHDEFQLPAVAIGLYDVVLAWDHDEHRSWLISHGWPERNPAARLDRARQRLRFFRDRLSDAIPPTTDPEPRVRLPRESLASQFATPATREPLAAELTSNFSRDGYLAAVARAIEYIRAGDIFQVNLSQRLLHPATLDSPSLYRRLRRLNPATFAGYFDLGDAQIMSASPERFVQCRDREVETRPIKGTRGRSLLPEADLFAADDLLASEKDRAENVMIVDLLRNDLSRVCEPESVRVVHLCRLETYEFVQHLVSEIRGRLRDGLSGLDLVEALFPGGSITGAPKVRAMQIIAELEPTARGAYCGALGYLGFDGTLDVNILIRTITAAAGWWQAPVGGGITAQSDPEKEYLETWHKAEGLLRAMLN